MKLIDIIKGVEDTVSITCIGQDELIHRCLPLSNKNLCGIYVK